MSSPLNHTQKPAGMQESPIIDLWEQEIVPTLPKEREEQAWRLGAMSRNSGKIHRASDLLRGIMAYVLLHHSFRSLGIWGVLAGVADLMGTIWRE